jgi:prephenate dehydratase
MAESDILEASSFADVWKAVEAGDIGVLPIENSYAGSIYENIFSFLRYDVRIVGETRVSVHHCLWSLERDMAGVKKAYSHEQALRQCRDYLESRGIEPVKWYDTAGAAKMIAEEKLTGVAAIASSLAGELYGLHCLARDIEDQDGNTTRFLVVAKSGVEIAYPECHGKTSALFETADVPAALYKCLGAFATNAINLTKIESVPSQRDPFTYVFFMDFEGHAEDKAVKRALSELGHFAKNVKLLGSY